MMLHRFSTLSHKLIQLALPGYCQLCGAESTRQICNDCFIDLPKQLASCSRCDLPFNGLKSVPPIAPETPFDTRPSTFETWCADCQQLSEQQLKEGFDRAITAYTYNRDVSFIVNAFKNQQSPFWADLLLPALLERIDNLQTPPFPEAIVPVPLHWKRYLSRGFNQSVVIAARLKHHYQIPILQPLHKHKTSMKQQYLGMKARQQNLDGAFTLKSNQSLPRHIAIVDDVITTGATVSALSRIFKANGVERVDVWALARTPKNFR